MADQQKRCCHYDEGWEAGHASGYDEGWEMGVAHGMAKQAEIGTLVEGKNATCVGCGRSSNTHRILFGEQSVAICHGCDDRATLRHDQLVQVIRAVLSS